MFPGPPFDENGPALRDCPQCGRALLSSAPRHEMDEDGNPEIVHVSLLVSRLLYVPHQRRPAKRFDLTDQQ